MDTLTNSLASIVGYLLITAALLISSCPGRICGHEADTINAQNAPVIVNSYNCASSCSGSEPESSNEAVSSTAECCTSLEDKVRDLELRVAEHQVLLQQRENDAAACDINTYAIEDCSQLQTPGYTTGVQTIKPLDSKSLEVYCEDKNNTIWTVIQRRIDGTTDFHRNWAEYSRGFGNKEGNFWLGLENIYRITAQRQYKLRIEITNWENVTLYAEYRSFKIYDASTKYRIRYDTYSGNAGDSFMEDYHQEMPFSTFDQDNDLSADEHCAQLHGGGWWFNDCDHSNLNGPYREYEDREITTETDTGIEWDQWIQWYSFKATKMSIAPTFGGD